MNTDEHRWEHPLWPAVACYRLCEGSSLPCAHQDPCRRIHRAKKDDLFAVSSRGTAGTLRNREQAPLGKAAASCRRPKKKIEEGRQGCLLHVLVSRGGGRLCGL